MPFQKQRIVGTRELINYLQWRNRRVEELMGSDEIIGELNAHIGLSQTSANLLPTSMIRNMVSKPRREPVKSVFLEGSSRNTIASITSSDHKCKYKNEEKQSNEKSHAGKVKSQETLFVEVSTKKAKQRNHKNKGSNDEDRPTKVVDTLVVLL